MGMGRNPQFWSSNSAQPEIRQENEIMRMISSFWKISKSGATAAHAHSLTLYALARLNRYPRIPDAGGHLL